jgi:hypothetical protein
MTEEALDRLGTIVADVQTLATGVLKKVAKVATLDELLLPEYRGHPWTFWKALQRLHDHAGNWDKDGLTAQGEKQAAAIARRIDCLDPVGSIYHDEFYKGSSGEPGLYGSGEPGIYE